MAVTNYHTVNGQLIAEETGGTRIDYLTDALGNVTATVDQSANIINTYRYKPYGGLLAKTGGGSDPAFQWVGSEGYRQTGKSYSEVYIRRRHYSIVLGRWTTKDPISYDALWNLYTYAENNPIVFDDPTGNWPECPNSSPCVKKLGKRTRFGRASHLGHGIYADPDTKVACGRCLRGKSVPNLKKPSECIPCPCGHCDWFFSQDWWPPGCWDRTLRTIWQKFGTYIAAMRLPKDAHCGQKVTVCDRWTGATVEVTIVESGPVPSDRIIDLSEDAFRALGRKLSEGIIQVCIGKEKPYRCI